MFLVFVVLCLLRGLCACFVMIDGNLMDEAML